MAHGNAQSNAAEVDLRRRIVTVDEALSYTPLTSIIPFDAGIVPSPLSLSGTAPLRIVSNDQAAAANRLLSSLDREASRAETASGRLQTTVSDIRKLIDAEDRPRYKLKPIPQDSARPEHTPVAHAADSKGSYLNRLSPFARQVLESHRKPSSHSTPTTRPTYPSSTTKPSTHVREPSQLKPAPPPQSSPLVSLHTAQIAAQITSTEPRPPPFSATPSGVVQSDATRSRPITINNPVLSQERLAQFQRGPEPEIRSYANAQVTNGVDESEANRSETLDQREKAKAAVHKLQMLLANVFEEEVACTTDNRQDGDVFVEVETSDGSTNILTTGMQVALDKAIFLVTKHQALADISVGGLVHIQKLCHQVILTAGDRYLGIGEGWDDSDVSEWVSRLALAEQALTASRTILRIMGSGMEDKQLFSEDILTSSLTLVKHTVDTLIISVVELRSNKEAESPFRIAHKNKARLMSFFRAVGKVISLLGNVFLNVDMDESAVTAVESLCTTLVFVENAPSEAESALGIQTFETLRRFAMDALAKLFARNKNQRQSIFDNVLTSLERLPVGRQSARQFKLSDAKPIQLVSALLMRLVQTSTMQDKVDVIGDLRPPTSDSETDDEKDAEYDSDDDEVLEKRQGQGKHKRGSSTDLEELVAPLYEAAVNHVKYITHFLVSRAINSSKSSGEPYRNLLDIFVEDFINVLGKTDWPAAELLLRQLLNRLHDITENSKSSAPSKTMALELMGSILTGITDLRLHTTEASDKLSEDGSMCRKLKAALAAFASDEVADHDSLGLDGPYRAVIDYLRTRANAEQQDANLATAVSYHLAQWAAQVVKPLARESSELRHVQVAELKDALSHAIRDPLHYELDDHVQSISTDEARLGSALVTLRLPTCRLFTSVFNKLLSCMSSDQASLRSKSLRSVEDVLQKDPAILDRGTYVISNIVRCMTDSSPQVRDAALGLLSTCLQLRPQLDANAIEHILRRTEDSAANVKKRSIRLSKEIYLRNESIPMRSRIADSLIRCISDLEPTVVELARQSVEDIWISPFHALANADPDSARSKTKLAQQASLVVETVRRNANVALVLQDLLEDTMSPKSKAAAANIAVCKALVVLMVDAIVDESALPSRPSRVVTMHSLSVFAQARPKLFTSAQLQPLLPYLKELTSSDDLQVYRWTIVILRCTLPHVSNLPQSVVAETQSSLLLTVPKLPALEMKEATSCLWTLSKMSGTVDRLVALSRSSMEGLKKRSSLNLTSAAPKEIRAVEVLITLVGSCVNAFDLDDQMSAFLQRFPESKAKQVVVLAINIVCPFTSPRALPGVRSAAVESILCMCQAWPKQYKRDDVCNALELIFSSQNEHLELVVMRAWRDFFVVGTDRRPAEDKANGSQPAAGADRIEQTYVASARDSASVAIAQRFMSHIIRVALSSVSELSSMAALVIINILKLGMVHPQEPGSALVALETSPNASIAKEAADMHGALFGKYESIFEKETVRALQRAFVYQRDTIKDVTGHTSQPPTAKLHLFWEVLKTCSAKVRRKFLLGICTHLNFDHGKLDMQGPTPNHVQLTSFCVQNLSLFDYSAHVDLLTLTEGIEKLFSSTGTAIAHGIEGSLLNNTIELANGTTSSGHVNGISETANLAAPQGSDLPIRECATLPSNITTVAAQSKPVDADVLRSLAAGSQILLLLYELRTFLRRVYSMSKGPGGPRGRPSRDLSKAKDKEEKVKAPLRVPNATHMTERFLARTEEIVRAIDSVEGQRSICLQFQEKISIDDEVKVKPEDVDDVSMEDESGLLGGIGLFGDGTPSVDGDESSAAGTPAKKGRKRKGTTPIGTPRKRKRKSGDENDWE
ncbi:Protein rad9 [Sphaceloma murrayae]|uniref:Sister chromatid cohesion protein n=1 Tax=Sphaceloma murrayae TaxID=2082308 RepID=A0A2K1QLM5_9PEZI|nr:Protein rad9 [Sphaceloma murrayae]